MATGPGILVLKGAQTVVAGGEDPRLWVNPTGHAGLATGGSGDFLSGMVVAKVAQACRARGVEASERASRLRQAVGEAVWCHGAAADRLGAGPLLVRDLGPSLAGLLRETAGGGHD